MWHFTDTPELGLLQRSHAMLRAVWALLAQTLGILDMGMAGISTNSLIAAAVYVMVVVICLTAFLTARSHRQLASHYRGWLIIALLFTGLVVLRLLNLEELWRSELRGWARAQDAYDSRRDLQLQLTVGLVALAGLGAFGWAFRMLRMTRGRRNVALVVAQLGAAAMVSLIVLRMISFSALDKLLYGPLKLNWVGDLGSSVLVTGCAAYYVYIVRQKPRIRPSDAAR